MHLLTILLQAGDGGSAGGGYSTIVLFLGIMVVFYFFMIRPQQKRQKEERLFRESLTKGDKVMTIGGVYGRVVSLDETTALVEVDENVKIRFDKTALKGVPESTTK